MSPLRFDGVYRFDPVLLPDDRGVFLESFKSDLFTENVGHAFDLAQMNISVSKAGTIRGVHFADVPPGQAKYVQCFAGAILDIVVDIRVGSPTSLPFALYFFLRLAVNSSGLSYNSPSTAAL